ncbi:MAG TPA: response regulator transcription factor, partial [Ferruginibacter sp.]|nr:response regulator transcription factor [Ferruginibacter sp.]
MIKLLIYDDNKDRCESLKALLMVTEGMECVASFPDCRDVVEQMKAHQPDIVLMDIAMPHVDGIKAVELIKKNFPQIRIIMQTVFEDEEKIFASLKAGAEGYLLKNATAEKITQSIEEVYHGGASMTPSVALRVMKYFNQEGSSMADDYNLSSREKDVLG